eukprot:TRINITY_DN41521_c0_g1_i1.p1 TRINITY_DN41521_c0_g1~~TRINITY_DN41521_c0_g1_i1.p1  ORF type:complete len:826 (-),score=156.42 TRINITY_DN41521_c0_g1_i1:114-2561(-)
MATLQSPDSGCREATLSHKAWQEQRAPALLELLAQGEFCDLYLLAGEPGERIPASRLLLAASSQALAARLREEAGSAASTPSLWRLPEVRPTVARAVVAYSCGAARPFASCSPAEARQAWSLLHTGDAATSFQARGPEPGSHPLHEEKSCSEAEQSGLAAALPLCILGASLLAYRPVLDFNMETGGFFMDDAMIRRNLVVIDNALDWGRLWRTDYWGLEMFDPNTWTHKSFRPLTVLTFRWNYLLHGFGNCGFHLTNALMHAVCSLQLAFFARRSLCLTCAWAGLLAALFAVHPVHTESICYVVGRADILCAQVIFLAAEFYGPCSQPGKASTGCTAWLRLLAASALVLVAGLCKETGFTFFGLLVIWEVLGILRAQSWRSCFEKWLRVVALLIIGSAACAARVWYTAGTQIARMDPYSNPIAASEDPWIRILSYSLVHGMYFKLLLWPLFLCYDYSQDAVPLVESLGDVRLLLPCAAYLGFFVATSTALVLLRQSRSSAGRLRAEAPALGLTIFALSFLPMTNMLFPIGTLVAERLLYLPSIGFLIVAVCLARLLFATAEPPRVRCFAGWAFGLALLSFWWLLCYWRVLDWRSVEQITLVDGLKQLRSGRTQFNLANLYLQANRQDEALAAYRRSVASDPLERDSQPLYHAGQILMYKGQYAEAEVYLHKAVSGYFSPLTLHEEEVWHDYGLALWHVGRHMEAAQNFQNAIITNPSFPKGYNNLACALVLVGLSSQPPRVELVQQGLQAAEQAISVAPGVPLYWRNAAVLLGLAADQSAALAAWERYRAMDPRSAAMEEINGLPRDCTWEFYFR